MAPRALDGVRPRYDRAERLADAVVHWAGLTLALMSVPALVVLATFLDGRPTIVAAVGVYGAALLAMLGPRRPTT